MAGYSVRELGVDNNAHGALGGSAGSLQPSAPHALKGELIDDHEHDRQASECARGVLSSFLQLSYAGTAATTGGGDGGGVQSQGRLSNVQEFVMQWVLVRRLHRLWVRRSMRSLCRLRLVQGKRCKKAHYYLFSRAQKRRIA